MTLTPPPIPPELLDAAPSSAPQPKSSIFGIGGPLFNAMLVMTLMAITFAAVALPDRSSDLATAPDALAFAGASPQDSTTTTPTTAAASTSTTEAAESLDQASNVVSGVSAIDGETRFGAPADSVPPVLDPPQAPAPVAATAPTAETIERVTTRTERVFIEVPASTIPPRPGCGDFATRPLAQDAFDADPDNLAHFDGDGDGLACEQLVDPDPSPVQTRCEDFEEWTSAQEVFLADRDALAHLDGDGDGRACEQLPGTPPEGPLEPPAAQVLSVEQVREQTGVFGLHTREAPWWFGEVDYVSRLIGKAPNNLLFFSNWATPFPSAQVQQAWDRSMVPQIAWEPIIAGADQQPSLRDIADGQWDGYIDEWAAAAASHDQPIVLRLAAEMNGGWYAWGAGVNGNEAADFVDMWRHVRQRFDAAGADNVIWLWSVNRSDNLNTEVADYWPGEAFVDWVGISGYWRGLQGAPEPTFDAIFNKTLGELRSITSKPILLAEVGAGTNVDTDRVRWFTTLFEGLAANDDIIGFVYFNDVKSGGDWRIQFSQNVVDVVASGVASDRFQSGVLPPGMDLGDRLGVPAHNDPNNDDLASSQVATGG